MVVTSCLTNVTAGSSVTAKQGPGIDKIRELLPVCFLDNLLS